MESYISRAGGYLTNPNATSGCEFCSDRTTDQFLGPSFNIEYSHHWRDFAFMMAFVVFNVSLCLSFVFVNPAERYIVDFLHLLVHVSIPHPHKQPLRLSEEAARSQRCIETTCKGVTVASTLFTVFHVLLFFSFIFTVKGDDIAELLKRYSNKPKLCWRLPH